MIYFAGTVCINFECTVVLEVFKTWYRHFLSLSTLAMRSFVAHCPELLTEDVIRRLMTPIECAMTMMSQ